MANLSSPPSPASTSSDISKFGINTSSSLYLYQMEQLKMLQRNQNLSELSLLNPTIFYTANPFWWQQLIFSLPPVFGNNIKQQLEQHQKKPESPVLVKNEPLNRDYILTPETPERYDDNYDVEMDEPIDLSRKDQTNENNSISSSLPPTPKINANIFSSIWSPASLVSQSEKSYENRSEASPAHKLKFNFDDIRALSIKRESKPLIDYDVLQKNCTEMFLLNNNNLALNNNNLSASFSGNDSSNIIEKAPKTMRKSLPIIKPDSTEYLVHEFRDERGRKERSFEVKFKLCQFDNHVT